MKLRPTLLAFLIIVLLLPAASAAAAPVAAQQPPAMASIEVDIWPEYDQPAVLVIYHITVAPDQLPADLMVRIPAAVGSPHAVASVEAAGMFNIPDVQSEVNGEWLELSFRATVPDVRVEYYDPALNKDGQQREYVFRWGGGMDVQNLTLSVQQPPTAANLTLEPSFSTSRTGGDGLEYYSYEVGAVEADTAPFTVTLRYTKPNDALTSEFQAAQPIAPVTSDTSGRVQLEQILPWLLGGLGLLLLLSGGLWYWRSTRVPQTAAVDARRRHSSRPPERSKPTERARSTERARTTERTRTNAPAAGGVAAFCHQCGNKAAPGDLFCRVCGTRLRESE